MLDPPLFDMVTARLSPLERPVVDAFAAPSNTQLSRFWTTREDAFRQSWHQEGPIWANPPFSLMGAVVDKIQSDGGNLILLCPEWAPQLPALMSLAKDSFLLPNGKTYRIRGAALLPTPRWRTIALRINQPAPDQKPEEREKTTGPITLTTNPTPSRIRKTADGPFTLYKYAEREFFGLGSCIWDRRGPSPLMCPRCDVLQWPWDCPSLLPGGKPGLPSPRPEETFVLAHRATPRTRKTKTGRGSLLSCGDIEANPGPGKRKAARQRRRPYPRQPGPQVDIPTDVTPESGMTPTDEDHDAMATDLEIAIDITDSSDSTGDLTDNDGTANRHPDTHTASHPRPSWPPPLPLPLPRPPTIPPTSGAAARPARRTSPARGG